MRFLVPWAMALGMAGAAGVVLLHLVARRRPASAPLPTTRFIPDRRSLVSRAVSRPRDLLLLALRALLLLAAGAAFAQPVLDADRARLARVLLVDLSPATADTAAVRRRAVALAADGVPTTTLPFGAGPGAATLTAALVRARRAAASLHERADSVELLLLSAVATAQVDSATLPVRALWPGALRVERVAMRADGAAPTGLARGVPLADVLGPALVFTPVTAEPRATRLVRGGRLAAGDSALARAGAAIVVWDSVAAPHRVQGLAAGDDVIVAPLGRRALPAAGSARARWADGAPAAVESRLGDGCVRHVGIAVPTAGDIALRPAFQRIVRGLVGPCLHASQAHVAADSGTLRRLGGPASLAAASALAGDARPPSPLVPWLLGVAIGCALLELALRHRAPRVEESA